MRVTGGRLGGRRLRAPRGRSVRPSADRVREALFARLGDLEGLRVLDLFAGTGALGIEALSRGASEAVFVERAEPALACLMANLEALGLSEASRVLRVPVASALRRLARAGERFELVLLDPPYAAGEVEKTLAGLVEAGLLAPGAALVLETSTRHPPGPVAGLAQVDARDYGETRIVRYTPVPGPGGDGNQGGGRGA